MGGRTDGQSGQEGRMDKWIDGRTDRWRDGRTDRQLNGRVGRYKGRQVDN